MTVDIKNVDEKVRTGKPLTKEEETAFLQEEGAVEGYMKNDAQDMSLDDFDNPKESDDDKEKEKDDTKEVSSETDKKTEEQKEEPKDTGIESKSEDFFVKLERELAKPEGQEDLKSFSDREKAYYHQMRRDRKNRQIAEEQRDQALFREGKLKKEIDAADQKKEEQPDFLEELKKKDPTDYLTVAEVIGVVERLTKNTESKPESKEDQPTVLPQQVKYLKMCEKEARDTHPEDFDAVMELTEEVINNNPKHLTEVARAYVAGENPALCAYELIKADPEFAKLYLVAKTKIEARQTAKISDKKEDEKSKKAVQDPDREKQVLKAQEAIEKNKNKTKTTGHVESATDTSDEPSFDDIAKMSDRDFARLPRKVRQKYLEQMKEL